MKPPPSFPPRPSLRLRAAHLLVPLALIAGAASGQTTITFTGGQNSSTAYDTGSGALIFTIASGTATQSGTVSGAGGITKTGAGTLQLTGVADNAALIATVNAGTLVLAKTSSGSVHAIGGGSTSVTINNGGTVQFGGTGGDQIFSWASVAVSSGGTLDLNGRSEGFNNLTGAGVVTNSAAATIGTLTLGENNGSASFDGVLQNGAGTLALTKTGTGALTLTGTNTYTGATTINQGTLTLSGAGRLADTTALTVASGATFNLNGVTDTVGSLAGAGSVSLGAGALTAGGDNTSTTFSGVISGTGSLAKSGTGTLTLSGTNTYSGGTTLAAGTLALGSSGALGTSGTISFAGGTLQFSANNTTDYSSRFSTAASQAYRLDTNGQNVTLASALTSSGGSLTKSGAGTLTLTGANTYTGGTTLANGTLALGNGGTTGSISGNVTNNGALVFNRSDAITFSGVISGSGSLTQSGVGGLTLTGANTFTGATMVNAGTLALSGAGRLADATALTVASGATFNLNSVTDTVGSLAGAGSVWLGAGTLTAGGDNTSTTFSGVISGIGSLAKSGAGTLTLSGTNIHSGGTTLAAGTLALGSSGALGTSGTLSFAGGTLQFSANNTTDYSSRFSTAAGQAYRLDTNGQNVTLASALTSSGGSLTKSGAGTLTLTGANTYTGGTTLANGTLALGSSGALGPSGTISFAGGTLQFSANNTTDYSARFSPVDTAAYLFDTNGQNVTFATSLVVPSSYLRKYGEGTLTLTGATSAAGQVGIYGGTLQIGDGGTTGAIPSNSIIDNGTLRINRSDDLTYAGGIVGNGSLVKTGAGTLTLTGNNGYLGTTTVSAGTLRLSGTGQLWDATPITVAAGATFDVNGLTRSIGSLAGAGQVTLGSGTLTLGADQSSTTFSGVIAGTGGLTKQGAGTFILTGSNSYAGGTLVKGGTLQIGDGGTGASLATSLIDLNGGDAVFNQGDATSVRAIAGGGNMTKLGAGTLTITTTFAVNGLVTVGAGTLQLGDGSTSGQSVSFGTADFVNQGSLVFNHGDDALLAPYNLLSGAGSLTKLGTGTLTIEGTNTYTGGTTLAAGTVALGSSGAIGSTGTISFTGGALRFSSANTGDYSARFSTAAGQLYRLDTNSQNVTLATALTSSGGSLAKSGAGTLTLSAANTFSGGTTVTGGTLLLGHALALQNSTLTAPDSGGFSFGSLTSATLGGLAGSNPLALANASSAAVALTVGHNNAATTYSGILGGAGSLTKTGSGTLTLSGANTYTGGTTVSTGTLQIGAGGTTGSVAGNIVNNAALAFNRSDATTYAGVISGSGSLTKSGAGTLTLTGVNTATGATTISQGTLALSGAGRLADTTALTIASGATFNLNGLSDTLGSLAGAGSVVSTGTGTLTAGGDNTSTTFSGSFSGAGLIKAGTGTLTLTGTYGGLDPTISGGTLQVGAGGTAGSIGSASVTNQGSLVFNRSDTVIYGGQISGTGSVTHAGPGTLLFTNTAGNAYAGGTTITGGGTLAVARDLSLGQFSGALRLDNGTLDISNNDTFQRSVTLNAGGGTLAVAAGKTATWDGVFSGLGNLTKTGDGSLTLLRDNSFTGTTTISAGTLFLGGGFANTGSVVSSSIVNQGTLVFQQPSATLTYSGVISGSGAVKVQGTSLVVRFTGDNTYTGTTTVTGTLRLGDGGTSGWLASPSIVLNAGTLVFDRSDSRTYAGAISGTSNGVTKLGAGTLTLTGASTYTGTTTISAGTLRIGDGGTTGSVANTLSIASGASLVFNRGDAQFTHAGFITGAGSMTKEGPGILILSRSNSYSGGTTIANGTLRIANADNLGSDFGALTFAGGTLNTTASFQTSRATVLSAAGGTFDVDAGTTLGLLATVSGTGSLTKTGGGVLKLTGAQTYSGATAVSAGTLQFATTNALYNNKTGSWTSANLRVDSGATLAVNAGFSQFGSTQLDILKSLGSSSGGFQSGSFLGLDTSSGAFTYDSAIANPNGGVNSLGLVKLGSSVLTLGGANTYSGDTRVDAGTLRFSNAGALSPNTRFIVASGASLDLNGTPLSGSASIANEGATLTVSQSTLSTYSGTLSGTSGLTKSGTGLLTLSGANTYSGGTTVSAGTLVAGHASAFGTGTVRVDAGTLDLGGYTVGNALDVRGGTLVGLAHYTGTQTIRSAASYSGIVGGALVLASGGSLNTTGATFTGSLTVQNGATLSGTGTVGLATIASGGIIAPGNSPGTLTFTNGLALGDGAVIDFELGSTSDRIVVSGGTLTGSASAGGITLNLFNAGGFAAGHYTLFDFSTGGTVTSSFDASDFAFGSTPSGFTYSLAQVGRTLQLTAATSASAVPEPSTAAACAGTIAFGIALLRRRSRT